MMCNNADLRALCPDSCDLMVSNLPTRGGTFIGNEFRSDVQVVEFGGGTNTIENEKDDEGTSWGKFLGFRI